MRISLIRDVKDAPQVVEFSGWTEFSTWFCNVRPTTFSKDRLPGWIPAVFDEPIRQDKYVNSITVAVFDLDTGIPDDLEQKLEGFTYCIAPTFSYFGADPKKQGRAYRLAIQLTDPVPVMEWPRVWRYLANELAVVDTSCKNPSRFYYQPYASQGIQGVSVDGDALDWRLCPDIPPLEAESRWQSKAEKKLNQSLKRIRQAKEGERNSVLNKEAYTLGRISHILGEERVRNALVETASNADHVLPPDEIERTIDHALTDGAKHPIYISENWHKDLKWTNDGTGIASCEGNTKIVFDNHPDIQGLLVYDSRQQIVMLDHPPPWDAGIEQEYPRQWTDADSTYATHWLLTLTPQIVAPSEQIHRVAAAVAVVTASFDPFKDYLDGLQWDNIDRLDDVIPFFCRAEDTPLHRVFFRRWMIAAAARTYEPGCKVDNMLVMTGPQNIGKSSFFRQLVPDPKFYTGKIPQGDKDQLLALQGPVIIEDAEMVSYSARDIAALKSFITEQTDLFRPPYARTTQRHPRKCVLCGTTNKTAFLHDETGGRRFWPVNVVRKVPFMELGVFRDQLWAEAVHRYKSGEQWWLTDEEDALATKLQEEHREKDPFEERLIQRFDEVFSPNDHQKILPEQIDHTGLLMKVSIGQAMRLLNVELTDRSSSIRVAKALKAIGWKYDGRTRTESGRQSWYVRG